MAVDDEKLGELLVQEEVISREQLETALAEQKVSGGGRLAVFLNKLGYLGESDLCGILSKQYGVPSINLSEFEIEADVVKLIPEDMVERYKMIPISKADSSLIVAMADPSNLFAIDSVKFRTGLNVEAVVATEESIQAAIEKYYRTPDVDLEDVLSDFQEEDLEVIQDEEDVNVRELEKATEEAPVVKLVNLILSDAIKKNASDIHIEPYEKSFRVRFRIDGVLHKVMEPPKKLQNAIISRVKIMSELDIAERRLPQDGRIKLKTPKGKEMDFRVSTLPTIFGEKVVLRLLDKDNLQLDMTKLGFEEEQLKLFRESIHKPYGMVLVTGPTGSGKTTTLYSALTELNKVTENISTAEDPVEYTLKGINQVQMHDTIGLNFAAALRAFLRQDPDVIMVGEIRDFETAEIGVKAALTGHMVLSTLHTNDAPSSVNRLLNMGIEPFLVTSSVNLILAQRLVRKICEGCKQEISVAPHVLEEIGFTREEAADIHCFKGAGCQRCSKTGYKGRLAVYEVMPVGEELKEFILNGASAAELKREAVRLGMCTLRKSALKTVKRGITTVEEVLRSTMSDN